MLPRVVNSIPVEPSFESFADLARQGNVVPVYTQLAADFETPLSAYLKVRDSRHAFLLESAESTDKSGRWSILGTRPRRVYEARGKEITVRHDFKGGGAKTAFLKQVHGVTCGVFQVVLGPGSDGYHEDHFHMDLGRWKSCR